MAATRTVKKLMTAEDFCDWVHQPDNANRWFELVRGEVIELPPPLKPHGVVCSNSVYILNRYARKRRKGYVTCNDSGVILERDPDTVRGPDIGFYEDADSFAELHPKYGEVPPRLVIEVLSPNARADRLTQKIMDYLRNQVGLVWVVDVETQAVTVFRPDKPARVFTGNEELTGEDILPGLRCRVSELFQVPGEKKTPSTRPPRKRRRP